MVTGKLLGILAVALTGLLLYVGVYVLGVTVSSVILYGAQFLGLGLCVLLFVLIILVTRGKVEN
ncbi:hypothetical protein [Pararhodospirillum photometricum]|uniref:Uncharacterized protein n=1 Tax=Pararhodospirillum photometricum DSM 122 TaxID=1150469 RepID=H6SS17_PARPM|nr:hypothetical protein [Pararhodospirillum photometricum]CCG07696.1 unnamed protein product [Pararhodospirillum photometricum DSM 122]